MVIDLAVLKEIMEMIKESDYPKSKQVGQFIEDVIEHFEEERGGA